MSRVSTIWTDGVLRRLAGWVAIPDNSTLGRLFRTFRERQVSQLETLNHRLRGKVWRKALRRVVSTIAMRSCRVIDVDSTKKAVELFNIRNFKYPPLHLYLLVECKVLLIQCSELDVSILVLSVSQEGKWKCQRNIQSL